MVYPVILWWHSFCDSSQFEYSSFHFTFVESFESDGEAYNSLERLSMESHRYKAHFKPMKKIRSHFSKQISF